MSHNGFRSSDGELRAWYEGRSNATVRQPLRGWGCTLQEGWNGLAVLASLALCYGSSTLPFWAVRKTFHETTYMIQEEMHGIEATKSGACG